MSYPRRQKPLQVPLTLPIKPGMPRTGSLTIIGQEGGRWLVDWDAQINSMRNLESGYVMDRLAMSLEHIEIWTGVGSFSSHFK